VIKLLLITYDFTHTIIDADPMLVQRFFRLWCEPFQQVFALKLQ